MFTLSIELTLSSCARWRFYGLILGIRLCGAARRALRAMQVERACAPLIHELELSNSELVIANFWIAAVSSSEIPKTVTLLVGPVQPPAC